MDYRQRPHRAKAAAFKERETNPGAYKKSCYALRQTIKQAKRQYRIQVKIESSYTGLDACWMWPENYYGRVMRGNQTS